MSKEIVSTVVGINNTRISAEGDGKGRDKTTYTLSAEQAEGLMNALSAVLDSGSEKVFVEIRTGEKEVTSKKTGDLVKIPSSFMIVREALPKPELGNTRGSSKPSATSRTAQLARSVRNG